MQNFWDRLTAPLRPDYRTKQFFLMENIWTTANIVLLYVVLMIVAPKFSYLWKPRKLRLIMVIYNLTMVALNGYIVIRGYYEFTKFHPFTTDCLDVNMDDSEPVMQTVRLAHLFYIIKLIELLDTVFFLVRQKFQQITFLHVFHHAAMPLSLWFGVRYAPGGIASIFVLINGWVHVIMYIYYALAAAGPAYSRFLWWKPFLTMAQMTQFIYLFHVFHKFLYIECSYPLIFTFAITCYSLIFLILFGDYFLRSYGFIGRKKSPLQTKVVDMLHNKVAEVCNDNTDSNNNSGQFTSYHYSNGMAKKRK